MQNAKPDAPASALLNDAARRAIDYLGRVRERRVAPSVVDIERLRELSGPLPEDSSDPREILELLDRAGSPATVATAGGRYFGFVIGGAHPAGLAADWLAAAWDQNAGAYALSPAAAAAEEIVRAWLVDVFGLPREMSLGFTTGGTMANFTALASGRHALLRAAGWDVEEQGLYGAPAITVVTTSSA